MVVHGLGKGHEAKIKTGTYTGDGTTSHAITGVGFKPKYVRIWAHKAVASATYDFIHEKTEEMEATLCVTYQTAATSAATIAVVDDAIISLDIDGFTVDDGGSDLPPNTDTTVYDYIAIG